MTCILDNVFAIRYFQYPPLSVALPTIPSVSDVFFKIRHTQIIKPGETSTGSSYIWSVERAFGFTNYYWSTPRTYEANTSSNRTDGWTRKMGQASAPRVQPLFLRHHICQYFPSHFERCRFHFYNRREAQPTDCHRLEEGTLPGLLQPQLSLVKGSVLFPRMSNVSISLPAEWHPLNFGAVVSYANAL